MEILLWQEVSVVLLSLLLSLKGLFWLVTYQLRDSSSHECLPQALLTSRRNSSNNSSPNRYILKLQLQVICFRIFSSNLLRSTSCNKCRMLKQIINRAIFEHSWLNWNQWIKTFLKTTSPNQGSCHCLLCIKRIHQPTLLPFRAAA